MVKKVCCELASEINKNRNKKGNKTRVLIIMPDI
jgi:hypothetical protein